MLPKSAPTIPKCNKTTEWRKHWDKIAKENTNLKTYKEVQALACIEWLKIHKKKKYY